MDASYRIERIREKTVIWIAWHLPREVVKWAFIRAFAHASTGPCGNTHPDSLTYKEVYDRWEQGDEDPPVNLEEALLP